MKKCKSIINNNKMKYYLNRRVEHKQLVNYFKMEKKLYFASILKWLAKHSNF